MQRRIEDDLTGGRRDERRSERRKDEDDIIRPSTPCTGRLR